MRRVVPVRAKEDGEAVSEATLGLCQSLHNPQHQRVGGDREDTVQSVEIACHPTLLHGIVLQVVNKQKVNVGEEKVTLHHHKQHGRLVKSEREGGEDRVLREGRGGGREGKGKCFGEGKVARRSDFKAGRVHPLASGERGVESYVRVEEGEGFYLHLKVGDEGNVNLGKNKNDSCHFKTQKVGGGSIQIEEDRVSVEGNNVGRNSILFFVESEGDSAEEVALLVDIRWQQSSDSQEGRRRRSEANVFCAHCFGVKNEVVVLKVNSAIVGEVRDGVKGGRERVCPSSFLKTGVGVNVDVEGERRATYRLQIVFYCLVKEESVRSRRHSFQPQNVSVDVVGTIGENSLVGVFQPQHQVSR